MRATMKAIRIVLLLVVSSVFLMGVMAFMSLPYFKAEAKNESEMLEHTLTFDNTMVDTETGEIKRFKTEQKVVIPQKTGIQALVAPDITQDPDNNVQNLKNRTTVTVASVWYSAFQREQFLAEAKAKKDYMVKVEPYSSNPDAFLFQYYFVEGDAFGCNFEPSMGIYCNANLMMGTKLALDTDRLILLVNKPESTFGSAAPPIIAIVTNNTDFWGYWVWLHEVLGHLLSYLQDTYTGAPFPCDDGPAATLPPCRGNVTNLVPPKWSYMTNEAYPISNTTPVRYRPSISSTMDTPVVYFDGPSRQNFTWVTYAGYKQYSLSIKGVSLIDATSQPTGTVSIGTNQTVTLSITTLPVTSTIEVWVDAQLVATDTTTITLTTPQEPFEPIAVEFRVIDHTYIHPMSPYAQFRFHRAKWYLTYKPAAPPEYRVYLPALMRN